MTQNYTTVVGESAATAAARAEIERLTKERDFLIQAAKDVGASFRKAMERAEKAEAERDEARAQVAAAFVAGVKRAIKYVAGDTCEDEGCPHYGKKHSHSGDLVPPTNAQAALDAYGSEKVREGLMRAAEIAASVAKAATTEAGKYSMQSRPHDDWMERDYGASQVRRVILAEMEKLK